MVFNRAVRRNSCNLTAVVRHILIGCGASGLVSFAASMAAWYSIWSVTASLKEKEGLTI